MWKIILISLPFITFSHSSTFPNTISSAINNSITKSISTVKNITENDLSHFISIVNPVLATIDIAKHLISPTQSMNTSELIKHYGGNKTEEHTVISDGYELNMVRIPGDGPSVVMMHGIFCSSSDWMVQGNRSLPLLLAQRGYDVWMPNARGNTYSRKHTSLSPTDPQFWDFSFDELGRRDLPACIDYICDTVGEDKKLLYIGHSQGTTMSYILLSERPEYNKKLLGVVSLAPISYISNAKSPLLQLLIKIRKTVKSVFKALDLYEVFPHRPPISTVTAICGSSKLLNTLCFTILFPLFGFDYDQINYNHAQEQLTHYLQGSALKQILHFLQLGASKTFRTYDYGKSGNLKKYATSTPSPYKLGNIVTNITLYYCANDWLSDVKDVNKLAGQMATKPDVNEMELHQCNHVFFVWGKDAPELLYGRVVEDFNKYSS